MYKTASDSHQAALHRGRPADWVNGTEVLSAEDRLKNLRLGIQNLDLRIKGLPAGSEARKELGQQKLEWQHELSRLGKEVKAKAMDGRELTDCFRDMAKEMLPRLQYDLIMNAAIREQEELRKRAAELRASVS